MEVKMFTFITPLVVGSLLFLLIKGQESASRKAEAYLLETYRLKKDHYPHYR